MLPLFHQTMWRFISFPAEVLIIADDAKSKENSFQLHCVNIMEISSLSVYMVSLIGRN